MIAKEYLHNNSSSGLPSGQKRIVNDWSRKRKKKTSQDSLRDELRAVMPMYRDGGSIDWSKVPERRRRLVNSILSHKNVDWVRRALDKDRQTVPDWEKKGNVATHKLSVAGEGTENNPYYIYAPVMTVDGKLVDTTDPKFGFGKFGNPDWAVEREDTVQIPDLDSGLWFTEHYKDILPFKYDNGGHVERPDALYTAPVPESDIDLRRKRFYERIAPSEVYKDPFTGKMTARGIGLDIVSPEFDLLTLIRGMSSIIRKPALRNKENLVTKEGVSGLDKIRTKKQFNDEMNNFISYIGSPETRDRIAMIDDSARTDYSRFIDEVIKEAPEHTRFVKIIKDEGIELPMNDGLLNYTGNIPDVQVKRGAASSSIGHEWRHALDYKVSRDVDDFGITNMRLKKLRDGRFGFSNIKDENDAITGLMKEGFDSGTAKELYRYIGRNTELSAFLSDIVSLSGNKFPENLTRDIFEKVYLPRISKTFQHYYNHIVADKDKFINGINKYGFIIASLLKTKKHEKEGRKTGTDIK